jgi:hypothetical protein
MSKRTKLTFDGMGINGPDKYRTRVATFVNPDADGAKYGKLFAAAPELVEALLLALPYVTDAEGFPEQFKPGVVRKHVAEIRAALVLAGAA